MATGGGDVSLSEETFDVICTICSRKRLIKEAVKYCSDCSKNLCDRCARIHVEHNDGHTLVNGSGDEAEEASVLTEKCSEHRKELLKIFCVKHDVVLCSICALLRHTQCENLRYITESAEHLATGTEIQRVPEHLIDAIEVTEKTVTSLNVYTGRLVDNEKEVLEKIKHHTSRLIKKVEEMESKTRSEVTESLKPLITESTQILDECLTVNANMIKIMDDITQSGKNQAQLFILSKKGQTNIQKADTLYTKAKGILKKHQFVSRSNLYREIAKIEEQVDRFNVQGTVEEPYKAFLKEEINVRIKGDVIKCFISGCCLLPDGTLALADYINKRLIHVNPATTSVVGHCFLQGHVREVTCISQYEVAVCNESRDVQVVSLTKKLKVKKTMKLDHDCTYIAYSQEEMFITDDEHVFVHDMAGKLKRTIHTNEAGVNMFYAIKGIIVNDNGDRIYVTDYERGLICTNREGQVLFRHSFEKLGLSGAGGICFDNADNVLVCGFQSQNVVQISDGGRVIGEILRQVDRLVQPAIMCYDATSHRLYVGRWLTSELLVYHLT